MKVIARLQNSKGKHKVFLQTNENKHSITIPPKAEGSGSSVNGGELLFLALATCYCNDIYREAAKRKMPVSNVEVTVEGDFGKEGEPARNVIYSARVTAQASENEIKELMRYTDSAAEIQNTLRISTQVFLNNIEAISI